MQLRRNRIRIGKIHNIFISHTHGDHIFGLYGLLSTLNLTGKKSPLNIYAPAEFGPILSAHLADFDIHLNYELNYIGLSGTDPVKIFEDKNITVSSFPLNHRVPSFGFLFREKTRDRNINKDAIAGMKLSLHQIVALKRGEDIELEDGSVRKNKELTCDPPKPRSYAYCSDTAYFGRLASFVKGVDLLYHEATFASELADLARSTGHSTAREAAITAKEAGAGKLIIGHFSARYRSSKPLLDEASEVFSNTLAAEDNMTITI